MSILDNHSDSVAIAVRTGPPALISYAMANQQIVNILFAIFIGLLTAVSLIIQIRNATRREEREKLQADRDARAAEIREERAIARQIAYRNAVIDQVTSDLHPDLKDEEDE